MCGCEVVIPIAEEIVNGIAKACKATMCSLFRNEFIEKPNLLAPGSHDIAGCSIGCIEYGKDLDWILLTKEI